MRSITPTLAVLCAVAAPCALFADEAPATPPPTEVVAPTLESVLEGLVSKDSDARKKAAVDALGLQNAKLVRPLTKLLKDDDSDVRFAGIAALRGRTVPADQKKAAQALLARIPGKGGATSSIERVAIAEAIGALRRPESVRPLLDPIKLDTPIEEVSARLMAVAQVPSKEAIDRLITFLDRGRRENRQQRAKTVLALRHATGQKLTRNTDQWRAWWREAKKTFDFDAIAAAREEAAQERKAKEEKKQAAAERRAKRREKKNERKGKKGEGESPPSDRKD